MVRGRPQVCAGHPGVAGRHAAAQHLDALGREDRVDALVGVGGGPGVLAAPGRGGPAVGETVGQPAEGAAVRAFVQVTAGDRVLHAHPGEPVEEHAALLVALVLLQREMTAQDAEPGAGEPDDGGGEAAAVQAGGEGQEDVLRAFDRRPERAEDRRSRGCGAAGEDDEVGRAGQAGEFLAPAEETGGFLDEDQVGCAALDDTGQGVCVVAHRADVVAEDPDDCGTVGFCTRVGEQGHVSNLRPIARGARIVRECRWFVARRARAAEPHVLQPRAPWGTPLKPFT
ncbi:hypothetical protein SPURM210S_01091 [Streptomyces purpurascens]